MNFRADGIDYSDSLNHCTQVVKFQEDYMKSLAWTLHEMHACFQKLVIAVYSIPEVL